MRTIWRALTTKIETWPVLALSMLFVAAVGVAWALIFGRAWPAALLAAGVATLPVAIGWALRLLWSRSAPAARTLDQRPPPQRQD